MPEEDRLPQTVQKTGRYLPDFANAELMEQVLTERELKARQSSKIREIGEALITAGFFSLNAQAKVFGLPRSTAWTILSAKHKGTGLSARIICRMLSSGGASRASSGENHGIRGGKSSRYLRWDGEAAPQVHREADIAGAPIHVFTT